MSDEQRIKELTIELENLKEKTKIIETEKKAKEEEARSSMEKIYQELWTKTQPLFAEKQKKIRALQKEIQSIYLEMAQIADKTEVGFRFEDNNSVGYYSPKMPTYAFLFLGPGPMSEEFGHFFEDNDVVTPGRGWFESENC